MSLLMSKASPLSFQGLCCKTIPSPPQLYKAREGLSPSPVWNKKRNLSVLYFTSLTICCYSVTMSYYIVVLKELYVWNILIHWNKITVLSIWTQLLGTEVKKLCYYNSRLIYVMQHICFKHSSGIHNNRGPKAGIRKQTDMFSKQGFWEFAFSSRNEYSLGII